MWYAIIAVSLVIVFFFSSRLKCQASKNGKENDQYRSGGLFQPNINDTIKAMFSKKQIEKKLTRLANTPPPTNLSYGAKCYSIARTNTEIFEYICPVCGEKTVYKKNGNKDHFQQVKRVLEFDLNKCRRLIEKVEGICISLDETEFCSKCKPNTENPSLCLLVNITGQKDTTRVCNISSKDIILIQEFLADELVHRGDREEEYPLVDYSERIKQLLGM